MPRRVALRCGFPILPKSDLLRGMACAYLFPLSHEGVSHVSAFVSPPNRARGFAHDGLVGRLWEKRRREDPKAAADKTPKTEGAADPHDVPLTEQEIARLKKDTAKYEDAIQHIKDYQKTIKEEATGGEPAKAHRALDNLDVVLERLPEAAQNSGVPKEKWQEVNETAQKLRDLFNKVHANIDAGEDPNYDAVADEIDQGIKTLSSIQPE